MSTKEQLNLIANNYHLNSDIPDKFIEDICQEYCCDWLEKFINPNSKVLELGFGEGHTANRLHRLTSDYSVIEGSTELVKKIQSKFPSINVISELFEEYQPKDKFDVILALHVFEHVDDPVSLASIMRDWLNDNGVMIVVVPNKESLHRQLALDMGLISKLDELSERDLLVGHQRIYSLSELISDFNEAGYITVDEMGFFIKPLPNSMMLNFSSDLIYSLNSSGNLLPIKLLANLAIVVKVNQ